ncbi:MAG: hypothetical protein GY793_08770 [Proteobacteria bacterium]|nr:hypothetical protein [Pseudomonadota bacterium]
MYTNDYSHQAVPTKNTVSAWFISFIYFGIGLSIPSFVLGANIVKSLGFYKGLSSTIVAGLILTLISFFTGWVGARTRVSTYSINRIAFGKKGSYFFNALISIVILWWFGFIISNLSQTLDAVWHFPYYSKEIWTVIGGSLMTITAMNGFKGFYKLSIIAVPMILISLLFANVSSLWVYELDGISFFEGISNISFGQAVSAQVGMWILLASLMPDLTRYAKSSGSGSVCGLLFFIFGLVTVMVLSVIPFVAFDVANVFDLMFQTVPKFLLVIVILLIYLTSGSYYLYSASLGLTHVISNIKTKPITILIGICITMAAILFDMTNALSTLTFVSTLIPAIAGCYISDFLVRRRYYFLNAESKHNFRSGTVLACLFGMLIAYATTLKMYNGLELFSLTTIPALDAFLVSGLLTKFFSKAFRRRTY